MKRRIVSSFHFVLVCALLDISPNIPAYTSWDARICWYSIFYSYPQFCGDDRRCISCQRFTLTGQRQMQLYPTTNFFTHLTGVGHAGHCHIQTTHASWSCSEIFLSILLLRIFFLIVSLILATQHFNQLLDHHSEPHSLKCTVNHGEHGTHAGHCHTILRPHGVESIRHPLSQNHGQWSHSNRTKTQKEEQIGNSHGSSTGWVSWRQKELTQIQKEGGEFTKLQQCSLPLHTSEVGWQEPGRTGCHVMHHISSFQIFICLGVIRNHVTSKESLIECRPNFIIESNLLQIVSFRVPQGNHCWQTKAMDSRMYCRRKDTKEACSLARCQLFQILIQCGWLELRKDLFVHYPKGCVIRQDAGSDTQQKVWRDNGATGCAISNIHCGKGQWHGREWSCGVVYVVEEEWWQRW